MQKYIAVVNPKMGEDEISSLISQDIAGALFEISHQKYALAAQLIRQVKDLSRKYHHPVSLIQDASGATDPLALELGIKAGADWVVVDTSEQVRLAKKFNKSVPLIWKGRALPKNLPIDAIMHKDLIDADARVGNSFIKHKVSPHVKQRIFDAISHLAHQANAQAVAVSDIQTARAMSAQRPAHKIIFAPKNSDHAPQAAIYWGVHPVFHRRNFHSVLKKGDRYVDATNEKHVTINTV
ncbi:MAG: hypothetical protein A3J07_00060 [Candidatus Doudnabacteria bacterium RIFCSPLOWO2_02_FULL_49_13]|uniref:Pyruvate kinase C-terminal domain-containing protein n=1 Tax=Candidatus Doudnabacteria bacterium RIFCSPHIGHO2_12_FULL_48_16 TaxID=1817838 RepID=A0A1F5PMI9_9BACT|nr:MAG: hypothetical protein A3B77_00290 [Candidatus Doudnabacteria bacterium RIFCSPHIGHO2_02_FULL_49_24]OGE88257.1 MAG: hypothetical protein A2760_03530 [Candidatus Doudnabacteria bacterium RIFCSPHIGHO2_01_FULL_50_67]OGE90882.1 MAG: hypothetical protein A3E29_01775 [Candidatus Doudnabacteria bacterium RIFCSPHIGHO2_12_FULL_48_16]OGF02288.1 MAG: hypothetical protein A3J07_00060 [Candidatus Doudnabacteria bacterium RIFCSPLOWO2_02_FULL_49_13]OGF03630.1 MAG: hypothetical protein A3H14_02265 [Candid